MRPRYGFLLVGLLACSRAGGPETEVSTATSPPPALKPPPAPPAPPPKTPPPAAPQVTVQMTAATLADQCGDWTPNQPPAPAPAPAAPGSRAESARSRDRMEPDSTSGTSGARSRGARADMACEQTSMQLAVTSPTGAAAVEITVKKVELFDEDGKLLGELASRSPTVWDASAYKPWDQKVASGTQLSVSYLLAAPNWGSIGGRHSKMYTLQATVTVGGADQTLSRDVQVMGVTTLPPNVRT